MFRCRSSPAEAAKRNKMLFPDLIDDFNLEINLNDYLMNIIRTCITL